MNDNQERLFPKAVNTDTIIGTVYAVTTRRDDDPHSHVEAVYTDKQAAKEHKKAIANNSFQYGAIAWGVHEMDLQEEYNDDE